MAGNTTGRGTSADDIAGVEATFPCPESKSSAISAVVSGLVFGPLSALLG